MGLGNKIGGNLINEITKLLEITEYKDPEEESQINTQIASKLYEYLGYSTIYEILHDESKNFLVFLKDEFKKHGLEIGDERVKMIKIGISVNYTLDSTTKSFEFLYEKTKSSFTWFGKKLDELYEWSKEREKERETRKTEWTVYIRELKLFRKHNLWCNMWYQGGVYECHTSLLFENRNGDKFVLAFYGNDGGKILLHSGNNCCDNHDKDFWRGWDSKLPYEKWLNRGPDLKLGKFTFYRENDGDNQNLSTPEQILKKMESEFNEPYGIIVNNCNDFTAWFSKKYFDKVYTYHNKLAKLIKIGRFIPPAWPVIFIGFVIGSSSNSESKSLSSSSKSLLSN